MHMQPTVLVFAPTKGDEEKKKLDMLFSIRGIGRRIVTTEDLDEKVGYLANLPGFEKIPLSALTAGEKSENAELPLSSDVQDDLLILCGFSPEIRDQFLADLRMFGLRFPLKAVLTETNQNFTLWELLSDIKEEHETIQKMLRSRQGK